jgi:hypothetical protein
LAAALPVSVSFQADPTRFSKPVIVSLQVPTVR